MKKYIIAIFASSIAFTSCEKKVEPVDSYKVTVKYNNVLPNSLTGNKQVNPKDSIVLDFTIEAPFDMSFIEIQRNGARIDTFRLTNFANKKSFSAIRRYRADSSAGDYTYRVLARNAAATFLGDGGKQFVVTVVPDFHFWSYRILQVPDTIEKNNKTFYSTRDGNVYSYNEGAAASASIDFGYFYDLAGTNMHSFYALSAPQTQLGFYDISSWAKNATLLKKMPSSINFVTNLRSSGAINTLIGNNMNSGTSNKVTGLNTSGGNNVIGFRTASGKLGAILVRFTNQNLANKTTFMEVDVKVQK